jgi:hypothetical protein
LCARDGDWLPSDRPSAVRPAVPTPDSVGQQNAEAIEEEVGERQAHSPRDHPDGSCHGEYLPSKEDVHRITSPSQRSDRTIRINGLARIVTERSCPSDACPLDRHDVRAKGQAAAQRLRDPSGGLVSDTPIPPYTAEVIEPASGPRKDRPDRLRADDRLFYWSATTDADLPVFAGARHLEVLTSHRRQNRVVFPRSRV